MDEGYKTEKALSTYSHAAKKLFSQDSKVSTSEWSEEKENMLQIQQKSMRTTQPDLPVVDSRTEALSQSSTFADSVTSTRVPQKTASQSTPITSSHVTHSSSSTSTTQKVPRYRWIHLFWQECSKHCDGGTRRRQLMCIEITTYEDVDLRLCPADTRPAEVEACNVQPCVKWNVTAWSQCSVSCGGGRQHRRVTCPVPHHCDHDNKPSQHQQCHVQPCVSWVSGPWSQCTKTCGGGEQIRHVQCVDTSIQQPASGCNATSKPAARQQCNSQQCSQQQAALSVDQKEKCLTNKMSYPICKMLKRRGQCIHRYIKMQCCRTCRETNHRAKHSPKTQLT